MDAIIAKANAFFASAGLTATRIDRAMPLPQLPNAYFVHVPGYTGIGGPTAIAGTNPELSTEYNNILLRDGDQWALRYVS